MWHRESDLMDNAIVVLEILLDITELSIDPGRPHCGVIEEAMSSSRPLALVE